VLEKSRKKKQVLAQCFFPFLGRSAERLRRRQFIVHLKTAVLLCSPRRVAVPRVRRLLLLGFFPLDRRRARYDDGDIFDRCGSNRFLILRQQSPADQTKKATRQTR
jgi:hypothetical protein